jgi:NAD(P)-dependent dehydrogenase (short-subunit alcohol dehydrogenase family)
VSENSSKWFWGTAFGLGAAAILAAAARARRRFDFAGKVVLITGGSRGLGLVMAREFAREGARLAICARDAAELARARDELQLNGAEVFDVICDLRDQSQVDRMIDDVLTRFGRIDVLINNAGVIQVGPLEAQTQEDFENAMAIHFWAPFYAVQAVLPQMRRQGEGRIVNIASIGGKVAVPHLAPYCASKFALVGLSQAWRGELAKDNIFVTTVCPGLMRTGSHINALFKGKNKIEYALFSLMDATPLTSIKAERAARQILSACRRGDAELTITVQAQAAAKINALFPELVAEINGLVSRLLPSGAGGIGTRLAPGKESASFASPSILTALADNASARNNELKPNEYLA